MFFEFCFFLVTLYFFSLFLKPRRNLPPGPWGLPILGRVPYGFLKDCAEARKKYGNIFMTRTGAVNFLYICDYRVSKEALSKADFANRPEWKSGPIFEGERRLGRTEGIIFSNGNHWLHSRRFLMRHLRDLGMGKSKIEGLMMREIEDLVEDFKKLTKEPSKLPFSINVAVLNIIWQLVASHRYNFDDKLVKDFMKNFLDIHDKFIYLVIPDFFPFLEYILPQNLLSYLIGKTKFIDICKGLEHHFQTFIDEHLKTLDPNHPRDLMDDYLIEMTLKTSEENSHFSNSDLIRTTFDLFIAGNDTTSNMIRWILIYMAKFPEIQEKTQKEIDRVVPRDTLPELQHRKELAYLDAMINEVQRHCSMISMGVFRYTTNDLKLEGYDIPKGTAVLSLAGLMHKDPTHWKNPEEFDPLRFLDEDGKYIPTCDGFQAFGIGKRQCLGEQFARMELFLIAAALLQNFTFGPPDDGTEVSIEPDHLPNIQLPQKEQKFSIKCRN